MTAIFPTPSCDIVDLILNYLKFLFHVHEIAFATYRPRFLLCPAASSVDYVPTGVHLLKHVGRPLPAGLQIAASMI